MRLEDPLMFVSCLFYCHQLGISLLIDKKVRKELGAAELFVRLSVLAQQTQKACGLVIKNAISSRNDSGNRCASLYK